MPLPDSDERRRFQETASSSLSCVEPGRSLGTRLTLSVAENWMAASLTDSRSRRTHNPVSHCNHYRHNNLPMLHTPYRRLSPYDPHNPSIDLNPCMQSTCDWRTVLAAVNECELRVKKRLHDLYRSCQKL